MVVAKILPERPVASSLWCRANALTHYAVVLPILPYFLGPEDAGAVVLPPLGSPVGELNLFSDCQS